MEFLLLLQLQDHLHLLALHRSLLILQNQLLWSRHFPWQIGSKVLYLNGTFRLIKGNSLLRWEKQSSFQVLLLSRSSFCLDSKFAFWTFSQDFLNHRCTRIQWPISKYCTKSHRNSSHMSEWCLDDFWLSSTEQPPLYTHSICQLSLPQLLLQQRTYQMANALP